MGKFRPEHFGRLSLLAAILALLSGCPMASPGGGNPAAVTPSGISSGNDAGAAATDAGDRKDTPVDTVRSQPVAMPNSIFSQGVDPQCTLVLTLQAKPVCFYGDGGKRVEMSGHINLVCAENAREQPFESPTVRLINKDSEFVEFPIIREDRTFSGNIRTHQDVTVLDGCFANRDPIVSYAGPGLFDAMPCSGDLCRSKCDGTFDKIELVETNVHNLPHVDPMTGEITLRDYNLLPPCGNDNEPQLKAGVETRPLIREADPVTCKTIPGGLFRCTQGEETFCATLFGERRECPATTTTP